MARCERVASASSTIADDLAVLGAQDPAVSRRVGQRRGQHGRSGAFRRRGRRSARPACRRPAAGRRRRSPRRCRRSRRAARPARSRRRARCRAAGPARRRRSCGPAGRRARRRPGATRSRSLPSTHDEVLRGDLGHRVQRVRQHAAPAEGVQHLRDVGAHSGAGAGSQHQDGRLRIGPGLQCAFICDTRAPYETAQSRRCAALRRQDSNLNYLNQNQRCCRLHHDGLMQRRETLVRSRRRLDRCGRHRTRNCVHPAPG